MVGMVRGKGHRKRPYKKIEQWMDNEILFPSVPRCRNLGPDTRAKLRESRVPLVGSSGEVNYPLGIIDLSDGNEKPGSRGVYNSLDDKIYNGQWNNNYGD
ncbi:hypothetical protein Tco_0151566 [Tanacetum coccineum]